MGCRNARQHQYAVQVLVLDTIGVQGGSAWRTVASFPDRQSAIDMLRRNARAARYRMRMFERHDNSKDGHKCH